MEHRGTACRPQKDAGRGACRGRVVAGSGVGLMTGFVVAASIVLGGCGMSSLTSGLGSSLFGSEKKPANDIAAITEDQLLSAAKLDVGQSAVGGNGRQALGCPQMAVLPQDKHYTVYEPGREGDGLAIVHRGEITRMARECQIAPGQIVVKYGFSGKLLLGPRGQAGTFTMPVAVHVADVGQQRVAGDQLNVDVTIAEGQPQGYFSAVRTVSFAIPEGTRPADYKVYLSFPKATNAS